MIVELTPLEINSFANFRKLPDESNKNCELFTSDISFDDLPVEIQLVGIEKSLQTS